MPIYEYRCKQCRKKFSQLHLSASETAIVVCSHCASEHVTKLISTIALHRSEASRLADLDLSRPQGDDFYCDRQNIGLRAKKQLQQQGIQPGAQFEEAIETARTGKFLTKEG